MEEKYFRLIFNAVVWEMKILKYKISVRPTSSIINDWQLWHQLLKFSLSFIVEKVTLS